MISNLGQILPQEILDKVRTNLSDASNEFEVYIRLNMANSTHFLRAVLDVEAPGANREVKVRTVAIY